MSFIRAKQIPPRSGNWYDYEVQTVHEGKAVRQKVIQYLGRSGSGYKRALKGDIYESTVYTPDSPAPVNHPQTLSRPSVPNPPKLKVVCKICSSQHTRKYGLHKGVQNYYCNDCHTKFSGTDALVHGRVSPAHIVNALNEFYEGMSFHEIEHNIEDRTDNDISHTAIMKWVNKYTKEAVKETKNLHPKVGDTWVADETFMRVDKRKKSEGNIQNPYDKSRSAKWVVFWDIIDADTRFLLASVPATSRSMGEAKELMLKAAERAGKLPKVVVTDKLKSYIDGIELAFGADTKHRQSEPFEIKNDNNLIERFQGTIKDRTKVMRALKNRETLKRFMDGWLVHYNFFRPHMSLDDMTPAEAAGLKYKYHNWADVVGVKKEPIVQILEPQPVPPESA
jgi:transposase-like protein